VKDITDLPDIMDYDIRNGRTYMYHQGPVLYPFGVDDFGSFFHSIAYATRCRKAA
jgi:beta-glucosidase